ncbi:MAG: TlpA family protein disulfide reductase [Bacteroidales bacterium]|nr:TlpA family protein disulfide reductase [Bacteroidales bacterium]
MSFLDKYKNKLKKKSKWSWASDLVFILFLIALLIPSTRTPLIVFIKKATLIGPSVSKTDNYGKLTSDDLQWKVIDKDGNTVRLSDLSDKPIFINFWATWCAPCIAEMPSIEKLYLDYKEDVHFLLVSYEEYQLVQKFLQKNEFRFETYRYESKEPLLLQSKTIPATFIIDRKGNIIANEKGTSNWNSKRVRELLDQLVAK